MLKKGDRVITDQGKGTVVFLRFSSSNISIIESVVVHLDKYYNKHGYSGTPFSIERINKIDHIKVEIHKDLIRPLIVELQMIKHELNNNDVIKSNIDNFILELEAKDIK